jgi:hypothetical protein
MITSPKIRLLLAKNVALGGMKMKVLSSFAVLLLWLTIPAFAQQTHPACTASPLSTFQLSRFWVWVRMFTIQIRSGDNSRVADNPGVGPFSQQKGVYQGAPG